MFSILLSVVFVVALGCSEHIHTSNQTEQHRPYVVVAILAKDKSSFLPHYLDCIFGQTYPKDRIHLWIRSNNNNDDTEEVLRDWVSQHREKYASVVENYDNVEEPVQQFGQHEWNVMRFKVLAKIRQASVDYAMKLKSHYFVADCDNFILPETLEKMVSANLPVVSPLLASPTYYSNYHACITDTGYYRECDRYYWLLRGTIRGLVDVPVVHCTYFVSVDVLPYVSYDDQSGRYEYVIFSHVLRNHGIAQYLDTRHIYGAITLKDSLEEAIADFRRAGTFVSELMTRELKWEDHYVPKDTVTGHQNNILLWEAFLHDEN